MRVILPMLTCRPAAPGATVAGDEARTPGRTDNATHLFSTDWRVECGLPDEYY